jgi:hypothetical protein
MSTCTEICTGINTTKASSGLDNPATVVCSEPGDFPVSRGRALREDVSVRALREDVSVIDATGPSKRSCGLAARLVNLPVTTLYVA